MDAPTPDGLLLRRYRERGDEAAFAELRRRHGRLVSAACRRETGDATLAEDAAQGTFLLLMSKSFPDGASLAGWLFGAARLVSKNLLREEARRRRRERRAFVETEEPDRAWEALEPVLNDALSSLKGDDREAVLLRFAGEMSLAEVGQSLGIAENAARMRVARALEKMRVHLRRAGVGVSAALLASLLSTRAAEAAPLATAVSGRARRAALGAGRTTTVLKFAPLVAGLAVAGIAYQAATAGPARLGTVETARLFRSAEGAWGGTLEFADDRTRVRTKTEANVAVDRPGGGLRFTVRYPAFKNVDVTTIAPRPDGRFEIENGGPSSSHRLDGVYDLVRLEDGSPAFVGVSLAVRSEVRLRLRAAPGALTLQEEVREGDGYRFRNRFDLRR